jgi:nucleotidyltransferase/DNA polymerase involved in DNA repair
VIEQRISPKPIIAGAAEGARDTLLPPPQHGSHSYANASTASPQIACIRIACILVADFPLAAATRQSPELSDRPLVLIESAAGRRGLTGVANADVANMECRFVSAHARAMGVRTGMTVARARAAAAGLAVMNRSPAAEASAAEALVDVALSFSPLVEAGANGEVYLDLGGLERLHQRLRANAHREGAASAGTSASSSPAEMPDTETALAQEALGRVARLGMEAAVGVASSKEVALLAARCGGARTIAAGREKEFLNWLPLDLLKLDGGAAGGGDGAELEQTLARWGIRRLGELARLDIRAVGSRLGARAVELMRIARGECRTPLIARRAAENFTETVELEWGVDSLEAMGFVMRAMLERVVERLKLRGMAAGEIALALELDGRRRDLRRVALPAPTNEARTLLALILLNLETAPPAAAVEAIRITVEPRAPRAAQADMFAPPCPAPERLHVILARLAALCGPDRVGTLMPRNSHLPGAVELGPFAPRPALAQAPALSQNGTAADRGAVKSPATAGATAVAQLAVRAIRPPHRVEVLCARGDAPEFVRGADFGGRVVSCAGPWRIAAAASHIDNDDRGHREAPGTARDYYDVALEDGGVYRLLCDLRSGEWYVDGIYD